MTKPDHTPVPRHRAYPGPAVLAEGFRPFFLFAGLWALVALPLSVVTIQGRIELPSAFGAVSWHYHEMLFGFVAAAIAGFLLTAIPNWTGRLPLQGMPLLGLVSLWLAGRAGVAFSGILGAWPAAAADLSFLLVLAAVALREVAAGRNWRNLPIVLAVVLFLLCNALSHAEAMGLADAGGLARRLAIAVVVVLIALIGGRIVPSFTRNWLAKRDAENLPAGFGPFDRLTVATTIVALAWWAAAPEGIVAAGLVGLAAVLNFLRLARWRGVATHPEPLLWVLHVAYLWIPIGLALLALGRWWPAVAATGAVHALTAGAMGTMTLAVMSRATLGHTGRALRAGKGLTAAYVLVTIAALCRLAASFWGAIYMPMLAAAAAAWIAAFLLFLGVCGPMLVTRRPGGGEE
ncbi:MAG: NnrS family protein [Rhodospirillales bacterium]